MQGRKTAKAQRATNRARLGSQTRLLAYQRRFKGTNIGGATSDALLRQNGNTNNEGEYRVVLTNPSGSVTSAPALLMIDREGDGVPDGWETIYFITCVTVSVVGARFFPAAPWSGS